MSNGRVILLSNGYIFMEKLPLRLAEARKQAGISQVKMAEILNVSRMTLRNLETYTGEYPKVDLTHIVLYEKHTGISREELLFGHDTRKTARMMMLRLEELLETMKNAQERTRSIIYEEILQDLIQDVRN
jgi:DNA-binding XRE family transcriptional regulator